MKIKCRRVVKNILTPAIEKLLRFYFEYKIMMITDLDNAYDDPFDTNFVL